MRVVRPVSPNKAEELNAPRLPAGYHQAETSVPLELQPCLHLWADVVRCALRDARGLGMRPAGLTGEKWAAVRLAIQESARRWFASDDIEPGTFLWCCSLFDLDPGRVRAAIDLPVDEEEPA